MNLEQTQPDQWVQMSEAELGEFYQSASQAMTVYWTNPTKGLRHLMNCVLFIQLLGIRSAVNDGTIEPDAASPILRNDFGLGYLFGLAANYVDACGLNQQSAEAKAAIFDVHVFTFGNAKGHHIIEEQNARSGSSFSEGFQDGMEAAHRDVNCFKRVLKGEDRSPSTRLIEGLLRRCNR